MRSALIAPRLRIGLSPDALELSASTWRGALLRHQRFEVAGGARDGAAVLALLRECLDSADWRTGSAAVVLSSHFVRYCLLPARTRLSRAAEQAAYVQHLFRGEYGVAVEGWRVAVDRAGSGARLACAVDGALMGSVEGVCRQARMRLHSVRPYLVEAANGVCRRTRQPRAWLAVLERDICALALIEGSQWRHVTSARLHPGNERGLFALLQEQSLAIAQDEAERLVYVCGAPGDLLAAQAPANWRVEVLTRADDLSLAQPRLH